MKQQTAIEWLIEQCPGITEIVPWDIIEHSIQMEKEQIINAHGLRYSDITKEKVNGKEYYNKTYEK
jgi:hypothetical protein